MDSGTIKERDFVLARTWTRSESSVCIESEDPDQYNTQYRLSDEDIYQRQGNTIITWKEPSNDIDLALSFQEEEGCKEVWNKINDLQVSQCGFHVIDIYDE